MKYLQPTFTLPSGGSKLSDDEYLLRVGAITQKEFDRRQRIKDVKAPEPSEDR